MLAQRQLEPERMDDPSLPAVEHDAALDGLARLNAWSLADRPFRDPIESLLAATDREVSILDLAAGSGDLVARLAPWLRARGRSVRWVVADISERALARCRERADALGVPLETHQVDAVQDPLPAVDIAINSLFLHHLAERDVTTVLGNLSRCARLGGVICDLRRSGVGFALAAAASRLATRSPVVHFDALASVRAAFTVDELRGLVSDAGIEDAVVEPVFPQRMRLCWRTREARRT